MRRFIDGYRWMWGAVRRWKGGPLWRRTLLFMLYVMRDLFGTGRRTAVAASAVAALLLGAVLLPFVSKPVLPLASGVMSDEVEELQVASQGWVRFRGRWMEPSDLGRALARHGVRHADVTIEWDAPFRVVDDLQRIMVDHGVETVRVDLAESF